MPKTFVVPAEFENLADKIGDFMAYWGFKKVHGKIWTHLFIAADPLDASDLIQRLKISKALVSLTLKDLVHYGVVFDAGKSARGTILYKANPNVIEVIVNVLREREKKLMTQIRSAHRDTLNLPQADQAHVNLSTPQLKTLGNLIDQAGSCLENIISLSDLSLAPWKDFMTAATPEG